MGNIRPFMWQGTGIHGVSEISHRFPLPVDNEKLLSLYIISINIIHIQLD